MRSRLWRILLRMRNAAFMQLGFDFDDAPGVVTALSPTVPQSMPGTGLVAPSTAATGRALSLLSLLGSEAPVAPEVARDKPARGRAATRARTAVLFSRLQDLGLHSVDALVLMRTRTVMVSLIGRTLRVNEGYAEAPEHILRAIVTFATARSKPTRVTARDLILKFETDRAPVPRREEPPRPGDLALIAQLVEAHRQLNDQHFGNALTTIPIRLSGRMATRLAHYDPGSKHVPSEIVMSRKHVVKHGWREAMHTMLHEMVHQWQHETGAPLDHGPGFRKKAREVGITPAARRDVMPLVRRKRRLSGTG